MTDEVRELLGELDAFLAGEYSAEQQHGVAIERLFEPHMRFFIARDGEEAVGCGGVALFDAFEEQGAARLAAWLVMTGEAKRLSVVKRAVDEVLDLTCARLENPPPRALMEELALASITAALGAGLFGQTLSTLLGHDPGSAMAATLAALAARAAQTGLLEG